MHMHSMHHHQRRARPLISVALVHLPLAFPAAQKLNILSFALASLTFGRRVELAAASAPTRPVPQLAFAARQEEEQGRLLTGPGNRIRPAGERYLQTIDLLCYLRPSAARWSSGFRIESAG